METYHPGNITEEHLMQQGIEAFEKAFKPLKFGSEWHQVCGGVVGRIRALRSFTYKRSNDFWSWDEATLEIELESGGDSDLLVFESLHDLYEWIHFNTEAGV